MSDTTVGRAELDAARLLLARMGISPADLVEAVSDRAPAPTFAEYVPVVAAAVSDGTRRAYGSYWKRERASHAVVPDRDVGGSEVSATASRYVLDRDRVVELVGR
ncbi:hypothetical protein [Micromonospora taraxaci]|uniref:hypothetical protein n=1 Tax=Micromonospora taraxaci TaxID=1316803 RepID=UPI0033BB45A0